MGSQQIENISKAQKKIEPDWEDEINIKQLERQYLKIEEKLDVTKDSCTVQYTDIETKLFSDNSFKIEEEEIYIKDESEQCLEEVDRNTKNVLHSGDKNFKCYVCEKSFTQKSSLKKHLLIHSGTITIIMDRINVCSECNRSFNRFSDLRKHVKKTHTEKLDQIAPIQVKIYPFQCTYCKKNFSHRRNLTMHLKSHTESNASESSTGRISQKCPLCDFTAKFKSDFYTHFNMEHAINIEIEVIEFFSSDQFNVWLTETEKKYQTKFILEKGRTLTKESYVCHRSGFFKSENMRKRKLKSKGSKKINGFCPAGLQVYINDDGSRKITFIKTHIGHENQLHHVFLSNEEREMLAGKIDIKIPFDDILDDIRHTTNSSVDRLHHLTKQDLFNIKASFNSPSSTQRRDLKIKEKTDSPSIFDHINAFSEKKEKLVDKILNEINSIENEEELAAVQNLTDSIGPTLMALRQDKRYSLEITKTSEEKSKPRSKFVKKSNGKLDIGCTTIGLKTTSPGENTPTGI